MLIHLDFNELITSLNDLSVVINDSLSDDEVKNVLFSIEDNGIYMIGQNKFISYKLKLHKATVSNQNNDYCQVKCRELLNYIGVFKNLSASKVVSIYFDVPSEEENRGNKVFCNITEDINGNKQTSVYSFDNIPIRNSADTLSIDLDLLESKEITVESLKRYTTGIGTVLQPKANIYGNLTFDKDYVIAFNQAYTILEDNQLVDIFKGIKLSYKVINFINKVVKEDSINVAKSGNKIYLFNEDKSKVASFIFNTKLPLYKPFVDLKKKKSVSIKVDKKYLKDVIKRLVLIKEGVDFSIGTKIVMQNTKIKQELEVLEADEDFEVLNFRIIPDILSNAILDKKGYDTLKISYIKEDSVLLLSDESESWYSVLKIKVR